MLPCVPVRVAEKGFIVVDRSGGVGRDRNRNVDHIVPALDRRYLSRTVEFAKRANAGVDNVNRPALILIGNKLPGEECELDIEKCTK